MPPKKDTATISVRPDGLAGEKCIITGEIDGMTRKAAEQILINAGATIEKSLNKKVTLVVLGENAGEKKVNVPILSMCTCAELPSSRKLSSLAASQKSGMR
jgi:NAD-dependent DNA ligase